MNKRKWMFTTSIILMSLFALSGIFFLTIQSPWMRNKMISSINEAIGDSGWQVTVEKSKTPHLNEFILDHVTLQSPRGDLLTIRSLQTQISLWRLVKKEIFFTKFLADEIEWKIASSIEPLIPNTTASSGIPFILQFEHVDLTHVHIPGLTEKVNISGKIEIGRYNKTAFIKLSAHLSELPMAHANGTLFVQKNKLTQLKLDIDSPSFSAISPIALPFNGHGNIHLYAKGPWSSFSSVLLGTSSQSSITGFVKGNAEIENLFNPKIANDFLKGSWQFFSLFEKTSEPSIQFTQLLAKNFDAEVSGQFTLNDLWQISRSSLNFTIENINHYFSSIQGKLNAHLEISKPNDGVMTLQSPLLTYNSFSAKNIQAMVVIAKENETWKNTLNAGFFSFDQNWEANGTCQLIDESSLAINNFTLNSPSAHFKGSLEIFPQFLTQGEIVAQINNLHNFNTPFYGQATATIRLKIDSMTSQNKQLAEIDAHLSDLYFGNFHIENAFLYANVSGSIAFPQGHAYLEIQRAHSNTLTIESASINTSSNDQNWPFVIQCEGDWKKPFHLLFNGFWLYDHSHFTFALQNISGSLFDRLVTLNNPFFFYSNPQEFNGKDLSISIGNASIFSNIQSTIEETNAQLTLNQFPLDFLSINPLNLSISGTLNMDAQYVEKNNVPSGSLSAKIQDLEIASLSETPPIHAGSTLILELKNNRLKCDFDLQKHDSPLMHLFADLPMSIQLHPLKMDVDPSSKANVHLVYQGRIEEFLDYFDLGAHRFEGDCHCDLTLSNNLKNPTLDGFCRFKNSQYENYFSGFVLQNINTEVIGDNHELVLKNFQGQDNQNKGQLSLKGSMNVSWQDKLPFEINGEFSRLNIAEIEWIRAESSGTLKIVGNRNSAHITAQAAIIESDLSIPERIPHQKPKLQVNYINASKPIAVEETPASTLKRYPIFLDLHIFAPNGVFISGRGLSSEWKGKFQMGGTYTDIEAKGQLELMQGEFLFSGHGFQLTEGTLTFSGQPHEIPQLNLAGQMSLQDLKILARLKGPLNSPQLAFQSVPPLPMGSILSHLLFGQNFSEINAFQAAQIVTSLATFSGGGSSLKNSRRSLGVDRMRIIATPLGHDGGQSIALQVGKYITRGVLVSVSQGPEGDSTNMMVEVDLTNGLIFQAESQQQLEQGKFSIKWNYNY